MLGRRGYALPPSRLGEVCIGGALPVQAVLEAVAREPDLEIEGGLVVGRGAPPLGHVAERAARHAEASSRYLPATLAFVRTLVRTSPYVLAVSVAGSLASGGFRASDDVDLNLVVEDGRRHLAYVALNALGLAHALRFRGKPVDVHTSRPLAPRLMTANLIIERSQCFPLARQDEDMAYELLVAQPVHGIGFWREVVARNPALLDHFPQLLDKPAPWAVERQAGVPGWLFPRALDGPARLLGGAAWNYMQWTRRRSPEALARVAYVRATMAPYALFERPS
jgi:predicted nucleotidyltransferase